MKFGKVDDPGSIDFTLPVDHENNRSILESAKSDVKANVFIGCAKWNRQDLKGFYPRGTTDELAYYSTQFNSIELNATFYRIFPKEQVEKWRNKTPADFKFFPKVSQSISQFKRLKDAEWVTNEYVNSISAFEEKLGMVFLQMHPTFKPKDMEAVQDFLAAWPAHLPLAVEFRHTDWYNDEAVADELFNLLEAKRMTAVITDTAGRRDLMHMRLSSPNVFIRYTGANHESDYKRLDDWFERLKLWIDMGLQNVYFFVHQNLEVESPLLSSYIIKRFNEELGYELTIP